MSEKGQFMKVLLRTHTHLYKCICVFEISAVLRKSRKVPCKPHERETLHEIHMQQNESDQLRMT